MNRQRFQLWFKEGRSGCRIWAPRAIVYPAGTDSDFNYPLRKVALGAQLFSRTVKRPMKATEISRNFKKFRGILRGFQKRIGWAFPFPTSVTRPPTSTWEYWGLKTVKNMTWIFKNFLSPPPVSFWSWLTYAQPERPSLNHEQTAISTMLEGRSRWVQNMGIQSDRPSTAE